MFCAKCGARANLGDKYCAVCGDILSGAEVSEAPATSTGKGLVMPAFGTPANRWWGPFRAKKQFLSGYEWLSQRNTLLVCSDHFVLLKGDEKRSSALEIIQNMGLVGAAVGTVRNVFDNILVNKKFELTPTIATKLFEEKEMVWCNKSDAEIWRYLEKPWIFIKSSSEQLYCPFNSSAGLIHACFVLWCTAEYTGDGKGDIDGIGCKIVVVGRDLKEKDVPAAMEASRLKLPD